MASSRYPKRSSCTVQRHVPQAAKNNLKRSHKPSTRTADTRAHGTDALLSIDVDTRLSAFLRAQSVPSAFLDCAYPEDLQSLLVQAFDHVLSLFPPVRSDPVLPVRQSAELRAVLARAPKPVTEAQVAQAYAHITEARVAAICDVAEGAFHERKLGAAYNAVASLLAHPTRPLGQMPTPAQWRQHFASYLSAPVSTDPALAVYLASLPPSVVGPFTMEELQTALASTRSFATPGGDGLPPEFLKRRVLAPILLQLANLVLASAVAPEDWLRTILIPLHKKGAIDDPNNYRGIALLSAASQAV